MICYKLKQVMTKPNRNNEQKFYRGVLFVIENLENGTGTPFFHNKRFSVLNKKEYKYDGADHSFPSKLRHEFALDLYNSIKTTKGTGWMKLPQHEYIEKLKQNDFNYNSFQVTEMTESLVSISINPLSEPAQ